MTAVTGPILEIVGLSKNYHGLRPLRIAELGVAPGERVAILGLDRIAAEVLVNLVTGASLPDAGRVAVFGRPTHEITDSTDWLTIVDRFGIVSERAVLLESLSTLQNLAMPSTLDIEPMPADVRERAAALAEEVALRPETWDVAVGRLDSEGQARVRLARALALDPAILIVEHLNAALNRQQAEAVARTVRTSAERRGAAVLVATLDEAFARAAASRVLHWEAATGRLAGRRGWFGRRLG